jgi:small-conductance mechanosensitive channel
MNDVIAWFVALSHGHVSNLLKSVLLVIILLISRASILKIIFSNTNLDIDDRRRWSINLRNLTFVLAVIGLVVIWSQQLETLALSMVAFAAALVIATKELIMCLAGSVLRAMSKSYDLGDYIEIGTLRGRVIDINLLSTTIMEVGPKHDAHQITGRAVSFPNVMLLTNPVIQENYMGEYVVHTISVTIPYLVNPIKAERVLLKSANQICAPFIEAAQEHMIMIESRHLVDTPSVEPRVAFHPIEKESYRLILRVAIPARERHRVEQTILHRFMHECFPEGIS